MRALTSELAEHLPNDTRQILPDLASVVEAWPDLPEQVRAGIVAMVKGIVEAKGKR